MITVESPGSFDRTEKFLSFLSSGDLYNDVDQYGAVGVRALASATPTESGLTARSWTSEVIKGRGGVTIIWSNTNVHNGVNVAIILEYGHGTGTGGWVEGRDYINPAIQPIFDQIANDLWEKVSHA